MDDSRIQLSRRQVEFLMRMLEIKDPQDAVDYFAELMVEERVDPGHIRTVIDKIMNRMKV